MSGLDWPDGFERTDPAARTRYPGGFEVSRTRAFDSIVEEIQKIDGAMNVRVETAAPHTQKAPHRPYQDRNPDDPGVVAYYDRMGQGYAVACDAWNNLRDNARAIALYVDAKRAIERYGVATIGSEFETQALPSGEEDVVVAGSGGEAPHDVLNVAPDADPEVVKAAARRLMANAHPTRETTRSSTRRSSGPRRRCSMNRKRASTYRRSFRPKGLLKIAASLQMHLFGCIPTPHLSARSVCSPLAACPILSRSESSDYEVFAA